jgi:4'-phosphopantetheinyl transferase
MKKQTLILSPNKVDVWVCQLDQLDSQHPVFLSQLSEDEMARAGRFKFAIHRNRFIRSHGFMRSVLARYLHIPQVAIEYYKGEQGKPYLSNNALQFNLSHSENLAILAVTHKAAVGIDIEYNHRTTDWQGISQRFFTTSEQEALFSLSIEQQERAFFDLWTRKEAYMKVLGTGLFLSPTEFSLSVYPHKAQLICHHSTKFSALEYVEFASIQLTPVELNNDYHATLALSESIQDYSLYSYN